MAKEQKNSRPFLYLIVLLMLPALACNFASQFSVPKLPKVDISQEQIAEIATQTGDVAATAVAAAEQVGGAAITIATEGSDILATIEAAQFSLPDADVQALKQHLATLQPDANGNVAVTVTEAQVNLAIQAKLAAQAQAGQTVPLENTHVTFTTGHVVLSGTVTKPLTAELTVTFQPYIANNMAQFDVTAATLGGIAVPAPLLSAAEATLNATLGEVLSGMPDNIILQQIIVGEGTLTIIGTRA